MSILYSTEWYAPSLGDEKQIEQFWEKHKDHIKYVGNDKCVYSNELSCGDSWILSDSIEFPGVVFYGLRHGKIDTDIWFENVIAYRGEDISTRTLYADDWRDGWCDGLTVVDVGYDFEMPDDYDTLFTQMPSGMGDAPPPDGEGINSYF